MSKVENKEKYEEMSDLPSNFENWITNVQSLKDDNPTNEIIDKRSLPLGKDVGYLMPYELFQLINSGYFFEVNLMALLANGDLPLSYNQNGSVYEGWDQKAFQEACKRFDIDWNSNKWMSFWVLKDKNSEELFRVFTEDMRRSIREVFDI